jgi:hypothetical protein
MATDPQVVEVPCHSGYTADEEPRAVVIDGRGLEVVRIERRWREPDARCFVVHLADGARCELRAEVTTGAWTMSWRNHARIVAGLTSWQHFRRSSGVSRLPGSARAEAEFGLPRTE